MMKNKVLSEFNTRIKGAEKIYSDLCAEIDSKKALQSELIPKLESEIKEKNEILSGLVSEIEEKKNTITELNKELAPKQKGLEELDKSLSELSSRVSELRKEVPSVNILSDYFQTMPVTKTIYSIDDSITQLFTDSNEKYVMEKKYNGIRATIHKKGDAVKLFSNLIDCAYIFPKIIEEAKKIDIKELDYAIDGVIIYSDARLNIGKTGLKEIVSMKSFSEKIDDSKIQFYAFDIVYNGKDISGSPLSERKRNLKMFEYGNTIKYSPFVIVSNKDDAKRGIELFSKMGGSVGCLIKKVDGKYDSKNSDWTQFKPKQTINSVIYSKENLQDGKVKYSFGVESDNDIISNVVDFNGKKILCLGESIIDKDDLFISDIVSLEFEDIIRNNYKNNSFNYSIVNPKIIGKNNYSAIAKLSDLDNLVLSIGEETYEK